MILNACLLTAALLAAAATASGSQPANILLLVADDVSPEIIGAYGEGADPAPTPNLDALAARGVRFQRCWAAPVCSPTRATILTGRHGFRTGVGHLVTKSEPPIGKIEMTLAKAMSVSAIPYETALYGKWHLGGGSHGPLASGFATFVGNLEGLAKAPNQGYFLWERFANGQPAMSTAYNTTSVIDDAAMFVTSAPEPWFACVALNAAHLPFDPPPQNLHTQNLSGNSSARARYKAIVEAMDTEIGRLLGGMPPGLRSRTQVVFVGDNGVPAEAAMPPIAPNKAKGTLYEGGVRVPLLIAGPHVLKPGVCDALIHTTDLFPTLLEIAGLSVDQVVPQGRVTDGRSLLPCLQDPSFGAVHEEIFTESFLPNGAPFVLRADAMRDRRYKMIWWPDRTELFDLISDPYEQHDLLLGTLLPAQKAAASRLTRRRAELFASEPFLAGKL